jgi:hypothetical protein
MRRRVWRLTASAPYAAADVAPGDVGLIPKGVVDLKARGEAGPTAEHLGRVGEEARDALLDGGAAALSDGEPVGAA